MRLKSVAVSLAVLSIAGVLAAWASPSDLSPFFKPGAVRVLIISGRNNHDWRTTTPFLKDLLVTTGRFDVRVCEEPQGITADTLQPYQALVLDYCGPRWGKTTEAAVAGFVRSGRGLVIVHGALYGFNGLEVLGDGHRPTGVTEPVWEEFAQMAGGYWRAAPPKRFHGQHHCFQVKIADPDHEIVQGMGGGFKATDELYHQMQLIPGIRILATAYDDPKRGGTGRDEPMLWTHTYGEGRVFYTALGHETPAMQEPGFITTFVRGTEWVATGKVAKSELNQATSPHLSPVRTLVVTGGHTYESSFYTLFEGYDDLVWNHAVSNHEAFRQPITQKYDVILLYDFSQELDEKGRKNLSDFVESGKGLVVLHHAVADYQTWPWWYQEVTGGRYLLKEEGQTPGSTYKHDQELVVETATQHPITAGLVLYMSGMRPTKGCGSLLASRSFCAPTIQTATDRSHGSALIPNPVLL